MCEEMHVQAAQAVCPCTLLDKPCTPNCTCNNPLLSGGCLYCCTYGNTEQQVAQAKKIKKEKDRTVSLIKALTIITGPDWTIRCGARNCVYDPKPAGTICTANKCSCTQKAEKIIDKLHAAMAKFRAD